MTNWTEKFSASLWEKNSFAGFTSEMEKARALAGTELLQVMKLAQLPTVALHLFTTSPLKSCNVKCHVVYSTVQSIPAIFPIAFSYSSTVNYMRRERLGQMCEE